LPPFWYQYITWYKVSKTIWYNKSMNKKLHIQGFTLIEMLIVIAVISILAGIVLVGITGFQSSARDTKRVGDMRTVQNSLELFYTRCGHYPVGTGGCADAASGTTGDNNTFTDWADLETSLAAANVADRLPNDPREGSTYEYTSGDGGFAYVLKAILENNSNTLNDTSELDGSPYGANCGTAGPDELEYCIGSSS